MKGWQRELLVVAAGVVAVVAAGTATARLTQIALAAALGYLGWHLLQLVRFYRHLQDASLGKNAPPGIWGDIWSSAFDVQAAEHRIRKKLARFDARFRDAAALFPDALVALSRSHNVRWCNAMAAELLFGGPGVQVTGRKLAQLLDSPRLVDYLDSRDFGQPLLISPPHDRSRVLSVRMLPFGRKKHQLLLIASDITGTYRLDAARRDFVANVSHELRTPLTVITGYLEPLAEFHDGDAEWMHSIDLMQDQAARMRQMIDDLTLLSRLETEDKLRHDTNIDMRRLTVDVVREARALSVASGHRLDIATADAVNLSGDEIEIRSAVSNLIFNALRHTPGGTRVEIRWQATADGAEFVVADDGPGIAEEHLPRLTERFYRVDPGRARRSGGTGLGLAIVKHVLSRHDAQLTIDSEPDKGSTFRCEFPAARILRTPAVAADNRG